MLNFKSTKFIFNDLNENKLFQGFNKNVYTKFYKAVARIKYIKTKLLKLMIKTGLLAFIKNLCYYFNSVN